MVRVSAAQTPDGKIRVGAPGFPSGAFLYRYDSEDSYLFKVSQILNDLKLHGDRKGACCHVVPVFVTVVTLCTTYFNSQNIELFYTSPRTNHNNFPHIALKNFCNVENLKGKVRPRRGHGGQEVSICIALLFL